MTKQEIKKTILEGYKSALCPDANEELKPDTIIDISSINKWSEELGYAIYVGLQEHNSNDSWNELRKDNVVLDTDVPESLTLDGWVDYFFNIQNN